MLAPVDRDAGDAGGEEVGLWVMVRIERVVVSRVFGRDVDDVEGFGDGDGGMAVEEAEGVELVAGLGRLGVALEVEAEGEALHRVVVWFAVEESAELGEELVDGEAEARGEEEPGVEEDGAGATDGGEGASAGCSWLGDRWTTEF